MLFVKLIFVARGFGVSSKLSISVLQTYGTLVLALERVPLLHSIGNTGYLCFCRCSGPPNQKRKPMKAIKPRRPRQPPAQEQAKQTTQGK